MLGLRFWHIRRFRTRTGLAGLGVEAGSLFAAPQILAQCICQALFTGWIFGRHEAEIGLSLWGYLGL
jgi:hypothetical protein